MATTLEELRNKIQEFNKERDWDKYHNPKDLFVAMVSEVGELAECYRWLTEEEVDTIHSHPEKKKQVEEEVADIMMYLIMISYKTDIDIFKAVEEKLEKNAKRYPVDKIKGVHTNPIQGYKG
ncbi:MAG: nucleotide pyrophosphohydrolase [Candidatus Woesearchaeota archaeon]